MSGRKTLKGKTLEKFKDNKSIVKMLVEANQKGVEEAKIERDMIREASQKRNEKIWDSVRYGGGGSLKMSQFQFGNFGNTGGGLDFSKMFE